jgi:hypothetical protein
MRRDHTCRIVRERAVQEPAWVLYWDGAYLDRFDTTRNARSAALALCSRRQCEVVEVSVEDDAGHRVSTERLLHEPER